METPKSVTRQIRLMRNHTPRLSERKKKLFDGTVNNETPDEEEEMLRGIEPLRATSQSKCVTPKSGNTMAALLGSCKKSQRVISFFETDSEDGDTGDEHKCSPSRRSVRLSLKKSLNANKFEQGILTSPHKENIPVPTPTHKEAQEAKQLQKMFSSSLQITPRNKTALIVAETSSDDEELKQKRKTLKKSLNKRPCDTRVSTGLSPMRKLSKTTYTSPIESVSISTKSFYSGKSKISPNGRTSCRNLFGLKQNETVSPTKSKQKSRRSIGSQNTSINRGVRHKIRKRSSNVSLGPRHYLPIDIDHILNNVRNEKLRNIIMSKREQKQQIEKVHSIFRKACNPIAMARPLSFITNEDDTNNNNISEDGFKDKACEPSQTIYQTDTDFSDIECDTEEVDGNEVEDVCDQGNFNFMTMNEEVIPLIRHQPDEMLTVKLDNTVNRKFFKSGRSTSTRKEVHLTNTIKATVMASGKLAIMPEKKKIKRRIKMRNSVTNEFSDEQATVNVILRNLDDTGFGDVILSEKVGVDDDSTQKLIDNNAFFNEINEQLKLISNEETPSLIDDIVLLDNQDFNEFRKRLPYNTTDPEIIERQHLLLDFLITNNICTEENFNIFIADPDNHKVEAEQIVDDLVIVVTDNQCSDFRLRIPYNTTDTDIIHQQYSFLHFLLENNICNEENFDIFIANYDQRKGEAEAILSQYVMDVNAQQCTEIGTVSSNLQASDLQAGTHLLINDKINLNLSAHSYEINESYENINAEANNFGNMETVPQQILQTPSLAPCTTNVSFTSGAAPIALKPQQTEQQQQQKLYPVFYPGGCQPLPLPTSTRRRNQQRLWNAGYGSNQYQIDAGQKAFGAHQCKQCGLVYTVHEPEEEKLHRDFHASLHILRFKGWIDEDIVAIYTEWGADGRILRLTESSPPKRRERLMDILKIVDKELGFSSYIIPTTFVAYFAVRKAQIVGLCLVQPLNKANKYLSVNGVDCCTQEQFEAKCGISRIWVSPLHRRFRIGAKLIQTVQLNTIFGEEVPLDKIAFSAPTEIGKAFAQKITNTENFLVYQ